MKKSLLKLAGAALLAFALSNVAQANPISGEIDFFGVATLDDVAATATKVTSFGTVYVVSGTSTGDYAGIAPLTLATFTPFTFGSVGTTGVLGAPVNPLWTVTSGSMTYSFELTSISLNSFSGTQRLVEGDGIATITGGANTYDPSNGHWALSTSGGSATLSFSSSTNVPDGGTTALLVGVALLGLGVMSRRKAA